MENIKPFGFSRHLDYIKINFFIMYKRILEYKSNVWIVLIEQLFYIGAFFLFFKVLVSNFDNIIPWEFIDFILFFIIYDFAQVFVGIYGWNWARLKNDIKTGGLNQYLLRPLKPYAAWFFHEPNIVGVIYTFLQLGIYGIFLIFYGVQVNNIPLAVFIFLLICLLFIIMMEFFKSLDFIRIGMADIFTAPFDSLFTVTRSFPAPFFKENIIKYVLLVVPFFYVGSLIIPILRQYPIWEFKLQLMILIGLIILFSIGTLINWKKGLVKYEAFG